MPTHSRPIYLFSRTPHDGVKHFPIIHVTHFPFTVDFNHYDIVIATSKEIFTALDTSLTWKGVKVVAISESTATEAKRYGAEVVGIAKGNANSLFTLLRERFPAKKILYPHAKVVAVKADMSDLDIDEKIVYETGCNPQHLKLEEDAICIFTSPSSVRCFLEENRLLPTYTILCIGETTASVLPEGITYQIPSDPSIDTLVQLAQKITLS